MATVNVGNRVEPSWAVIMEYSVVEEHLLLFEIGIRVQDITFCCIYIEVKFCKYFMTGYYIYYYIYFNLRSM